MRNVPNETAVKINISACSSTTTWMVSMVAVLQVG